MIHFWERYESNTALGRHNTLPEVTGFMEKVGGALHAALVRLAWRVSGCVCSWLGAHNTLPEATGFMEKVGGAQV